MGEVIHGIDAPGISCVVMTHMGHPVDYRITHIDVGGSHVDAGANTNPTKEDVEFVEAYPTSTFNQIPSFARDSS